MSDKAQDSELQAEIVRLTIDRDNWRSRAQELAELTDAIDAARKEVQP